MPRERRLIRFSLDEVHLALRMFAARINLKISDSKLIGVHDSPNGGSENLLCFEEEGDNQIISDNRLATCLMAFCIKNKIPLPRDATKSLHVLDNLVDIRITLPVHGLSTPEEASEHSGGREIESVQV